MDAALVALTDRGVRFTFLGEPFRSWQKISNEEIVDVNFSGVEITDADVEPLAALVHLEGISFWNTGVSDQAIQRISQLPRLTRLNLCGTRITDASVPVLIGMALKYVDVANTNLTPQGVNLLRTGLPNAEVLS
jgi:hypothetical protein